jgi:hypothetical protein
MELWQQVVIFGLGFGVIFAAAWLIVRGRLKDRS